MGLDHFVAEAFDRCTSLPLLLTVFDQQHGNKRVDAAEFVNLFASLRICAGDVHELRTLVFGDDLAAGLGEVGRRAVDIFVR